MEQVQQNMRLSFKEARAAFKKDLRESGLAGT